MSKIHPKRTNGEKGMRGILERRTVLARGKELNLAGLLLFGKNPQRYCPAFEIKAIAFPSTTTHEVQYQDSEDIKGTLQE